MSTILIPIITQVGITTLISAQNRGLNAKITEIAVGDGNSGEGAGGYEVDDTATALVNEIQRVDTTGSELIGNLQNQLHMNAVIKDPIAPPDNYDIYEIGFFLETGELFAIYVSENKLAEKLEGTDFILAFNLALTGEVAGNITVEGTGQLDLPLASDNILLGPNTVKIHTQAEFDYYFNRGANTLIPANTTLVLSPIQGMYLPNDTARAQPLKDITAFADSNMRPGAQVTCTAPGHDLSEDAELDIVIVQSEHYAGAYTTSNITVDSFDIIAKFVEDDTGKWAELQPLKDITAFADSNMRPGAKVTCTSPGHDLRQNAELNIVIVQSEHYAGTYTTSNITVDSFDIIANFVEDDTGKWAERDVFIEISEFSGSSDPGNKITCTSIAHPFFSSTAILITQSAYYNGVYESLSNVFADSFDISGEFVHGDISDGAWGGMGNGVENTFNGRPAYVLKNSVELKNNVSIIGFNQEDTLVVKDHAETKFIVQGDAINPVTGIQLQGWSFDGRGNVGDSLGGTLVGPSDGAAFHLTYCEHSTLNCKIINHHTSANGGGIAGAQGVRHITATKLYQNKADNGGGVYNCDDATLVVYDCEADTAGSGVHSCDNAWLRLFNCDAASSNGIVVKDHGNVGVGTTTPGAQLSINGGLHVGGDSDPGDNNLEVDGTLVVDGTTTFNSDVTVASDLRINTNEIRAFDGDGLKLYNDGGAGIFVEDGGNVGIGTSSPLEAVHINGNLRVDGGEFQSWGPIKFHPDVDESGDDIILFLDSTGQENMRVHSDGNVGIGTADPQSLLHISSTGDVVLLLEADTDNANENDNPLIQLRQDGGITGVNIGFDDTNFGANKFGIGTRSGSVDYWDTFVIDTSNGNVGIGTTSPTIHLAIGDSDTGLQQQGDGELAVYANNVERMRINPGGVSIKGTLDLANQVINFGSAGHQMINLWNTTYGIGIQNVTQYFRTGSHFAWFLGGSHSDATFDPGDGGTVVMVINSSGNVGIGTTNPTAKLEVTGYVKDKTGYLARNLLDVQVWNIGSGTIGDFSQNGDAEENEREWGVGPHGNRVILWKAIPDEKSGPDGGWNYENISIDHTKAYRSVVWIKKTGSTAGSTYFGAKRYTGTLNLDDTVESNPYFWDGDLPELGRWYLLVGYMHGSGDTSTTHYGAIYDGVTGRSVIGMTDFKNELGATIQTHRIYLFYDTVTTDRQYFWGPRFEEINGNEPTIEELLGLGKESTTNQGLYVEGQLGLGTETPQNKLDVEGGAVIGSAYSGTNTAPNDGLLVEGKIGIGTPSPSAQLSINGGLHVGGDSDPGDNNLEVDGTLVVDGTTTFNSSVTLANSLQINTDEIRARDSGGLKLYEDGGTGIFVKDGGKVGIGTTTPLAELAVNGGLHVGGDSDPGNDNLLVDGAITVNGNWNWKPSKNFYLTATANNQEWSVDLKGQDTYTGCQWSVWSDKSGIGNILIVKGDSGNVGIGTTTPLAKLAVNGGLHVGGDSDPGNDNLLVDGTTTLNNDVTLANSKRFNTDEIRARDSGGLKLYEDGGTGIFVKDGGKVGIGTTTPLAELAVNGGLHVGGDSDPGDDNLEVDGTLVVNGTTTFNSNVTLADNLRVNTDEIRARDSGGLKLNDDGGTGIFIENGGKVGIGTTTPQSRLDIQDVSRSGTHPNPPGLYVTGNLGESSSGVEFRHSNATQGIGFGYNTIYATGDNDDQDLNLKPRGTGVIGIKGPLDLTNQVINFGSSTLRQMINLWSTDYGIGIQNHTQYFRTGAHFAWFLGGSHSDTMFDPGGGTVTMVINSSGNVGIGTTTPTEKLEVNGTVKATALHIDGGTNTTVIIESGNDGESMLMLYGSSQGTGRLYVGQSITHGGGIEYNGDDSPSTTGAGADFITLWRRSAGVDEWTARNYHSSNDWEFRSTVTAVSFIGDLTGNASNATTHIADTANPHGVSQTDIGIILGNFNTACGECALLSNTTGSENTASGYVALCSNTTGSNNTASGTGALESNTTGRENTASGRFTLWRNTTGDNNTASGYSALQSNTTGRENTASGSLAGSNNTTFSNTTCLGYNAQITGSNQLQLGGSITTTYAYGSIHNRSDVRDKAEIRDTQLGLNFINNLRPVDFKWDMRSDYNEIESYEESETIDGVEHKVTNHRIKESPKDGSKKRKRFHHGFIAQEVTILDSEFGGYQDHLVNGGEDVQSLGYTEFIAPLVKAIQEQQVMIDEQRMMIEALQQEVNNKPA